jgi:hypothetical protein
MPIPRRQVHELVACHALERGLVDIYVEGAFDEDLIRWYLKTTGFTHAQVYGIDTAEVDAMVLAGLTSGNRQRLMALASALEGKVPPGKVSCVCDRDFEKWIPTMEPIPQAVLLTDFASMDCYAIDVATIDKFLTVILGERIASADSILKELAPVLEECFLIRLAHAVLALLRQKCCERKAA